MNGARLALISLGIVPPLAALTLAILLLISV